MKKEQLQERITKKQEQIKKLEKKIQKLEDNKTSEKALEKEYGWLNHFEERKDEYRTQYQEDMDREIKRTTRELNEAKETLIKYQNMVAVEIQKENTIDNLPELFKDFQNYLIAKWDEFDIADRDFYKQKYEELGYGEFIKKYGCSGYEKKNKTNEEIHNKNIKDSQTIILDLIDRVSAKTGEITSFKGLHLDYNNQGFTILNGTVEGKNGKAKVESITAGGYNIQRLHIRVLVK